MIKIFQQIPASSMQQSPGFENHELLVLKLWWMNSLGLVNAVVLSIENTNSFV